MYIEQKIKRLHRELFGIYDIDGCNVDVLLNDILNHLKEYNIMNISLSELIMPSEDIIITEEDIYEYEKSIEIYDDLDFQCGIPF